MERFKPNRTFGGFIHGWISPDEAYLLSDGSEVEGHQPDLVLYYYPHSINCLKVMMALHEKSIPYTKIMVNINLGDQYHDDFLSLNPKSEVPVLRDRRNRKVHVDSDNIIVQINKLYPYRLHPKYVELGPPDIDELTIRHAKLLKTFRAIGIETLTNGSVMFDEDSLGISPNYPYSYTPARQQIKEMLNVRAKILSAEANRLPEFNKEASDFLRKKATAFEKELPYMTVREKYEEVIAEFERLLDDCECQLRTNKVPLWLLGSRFTHADISFSMILYRLWQVGFAARFWNKNRRPYVHAYFQRVKQIPSFKMVTHMEETKVDTWPFVAGAILCICAVTYETFFGK